MLKLCTDHLRASEASDVVLDLEFPCVFSEALPHPARTPHPRFPYVTILTIMV
jgi:hypothetical protein